MEILGTSLSETWEKSIRRLIEDETPLVPTQHGVMAKELQNLVMIIDGPFQERRISEKYSFPEKFRTDYTESLLESYSTAEILHSRMYKYGNSKLNQFERCIKILQEEWYSRRAVMTLWKPEEDLFSPFPPCICSLQMIVRQNKLDLVVIMRSNDAWLSAHLDMLALTNIQRVIAETLKLRCGRYIHHAVSYHIYEFDYPKAKQVFSV